MKKNGLAKAMRILLVVSLLVLHVSFSHGEEPSLSRYEFCCISGTHVDLTSNSIEIYGTTVTSPMQVAWSADRSYALVSSVSPNAASVLVEKISKYDSERIYYGDGVPFSMNINSVGDWFVFLYTNGSSDVGVLSSIKQVSFPKNNYTVSTVSDSYFVAGYLQNYDETFRLLILDIRNLTLHNVVSRVLADKIFINDDALFSNLELLGLDLVTGQQRKEVYKVKHKLGRDIILESSEFLSLDKEPIISRAIPYLSGNDPLGNGACMNNRLGRLSWYAGFRLEALVRGRDFFIEAGFPVDWVIQHMVSCLVERFHEIPDSGLVGWPTNKYAIDAKSPLTLLVNNASILYSIALAVSTGVVDDETRRQVVYIGNRIFEYHEAQWNVETGVYRIRKGIDFTLDGVVMPWNWQTVWASALIELHKLTLDDRYLLRVEALARSFKSEWVYVNGSVRWHYFPRQYYEGWNAFNEISENTPALPASVDTKFEDNSHAGLSVAFVLNYLRSPHNKGVFDSNDVERLRATLRNMRNGPGWSRFISGDVSYQEASVLHMPLYGWPELGDPEMTKALFKGIPTKACFVDQHRLITYAVSG